MTDDRDRIARRHPNIPQDPLFEMPRGSAGTKRDDTSRGKAKSIRQAKCSHCCGPQGSNKRISVIRSADLEIFKVHDKFTIGGRRIRCNGSGMEAPL